MSHLLALLPRLKSLLSALIIFLPLVVGIAAPTPGPTLMPKPTHTPTPPFRTPTPIPQPQPTPELDFFSLMLTVDSDYQYERLNEPFVRVTIFSIDAPGPPIFEGYTDSYGIFCAGLHLDLPQRLLIQVHRPYPDGALHHALPYLQAPTEPLEHRSRVSCHFTYTWPDQRPRFGCYTRH